MKLRREFLTGYIMTLVSEGRLKGSPAAMAKQVAKMVAEDVPAVLSDIGKQIVSQGAEFFVEFFVNVGSEKVKEVVRDVGSRGFSAVWQDIQAQYWRGADAKRASAIARRR